MGHTFPVWGYKKAKKTLAGTILGTESANLIGYWPLNELSGTTADNLEGTAARDGTYTGVTLGQSVSPFTCPLFDGANDFVDIGNASMSSAFSGAAGTVSIFYYSLDWTRDTGRLIRLAADANNEVDLYHIATDGSIRIEYNAGGTSEIVDVPTGSPSSWVNLTITWNKSANEMKAYLNGSQNGSTQAIDGTWAGSLNQILCCIGASAETPAQVIYGYLAHCAIWTKALTAPQILAIYQAAGL